MKGAGEEEGKGRWKRRGGAGQVDWEREGEGGDGERGRQGQLDTRDIPVSVPK